MEQPLKDRLSRLPKVDEVLRSGVGQRLLAQAPRWAALQVVREEIDRLRQALLQGTPEALPAPPGVDEQRLHGALARLLAPPLRPVINATGVVIHTNLGRAPLAEAAIQRVVEVARGYCNLEYRLQQGARGSRHEHADALLAQLTGAEAHLVVNNNAAAVLLLLSALCAGREVVIPRGELVEIGGSFRVPDVLRASGALLREVGTTNRTHPRDYWDAIGAHTAALLKVHRSNFAVVGFVGEVPQAALSALARERGVLSLCDLGSGTLIDLSGLPGAGTRDEPTVAQVVRAGCDVVTFSCDKLLGGPQAGVLAGRRALIDQIKSHPLMRALRPDKLQLAALCATLELYRDAGGELPAVPVLQMLAADEGRLRERALRLQSQLQQRGVAAELRPVRSAVGGGALPLCEPASCAVALAGEGAQLERLAAALRQAQPPHAAVVARIAEGHLLLDVRTVRDDELEQLTETLLAALASAWRHPC